MMLRRSLIPDLVAVQAFECAARHGSMTRAAGELSLTQSAVSRQVKLLEDHLGVLLFERIRQRVILSEGGRRFLPEARRLLQQTEETMLRAMATADGRHNLNIATLPTFGARWLCPRLPDFVARHPGTVLTIGSRSEPFDFDEQSFDVAIHYGRQVWAGGVCEYLCSEYVVPVASSAVMAATAVGTPADLLSKPLLHLATRQKLWSTWFESVGVSDAAAFRGHRFDQFSMIIDAVTAGLGYALLPRYLIERELEAGSLRIVQNLPLRTENDYYVVTPERDRSNPLVGAFVRWCCDQVRAAGRA